MDGSEVAAGRIQPGLPGTSYVAAVAYDAQGVVTAWSPGARRLLGHRAQDVVGRPLKALLEGDGAVATYDLLFGESGGSGTTVMRHEYGGSVAVELLRLPLPGEEGSRHGILVMTPLPGADGSGDPAVEWAFDQMPFAGAIYDLEMRHTRVNEQACKAWGRSPEELLGRTISEVMPTSEGAEIEESMRAAVKAGEPAYREQHHQMPGEAREHAWSGHYTPLRDLAGELRGLCAMGMNITGQHLARKRLVLVNEASNSVGSTLDVDTTAEEMVRVLVPALADFVTVDLLVSVLGDSEPTAGPPPAGSVLLRRTAQRSVLEGCPESVLRPGETETFPESSPHAHAVTSGRSRITLFMDEPGYQEWARFSQPRADSADQYGMHSAMVVPLRARGTMLGVAVFARHRSPEPFDEDDLLLAEEITARAGVSMDNALRYTRQRQTALTLQNSLLPQRLPQQAAVEVAGRYLPSDARIGVGGDWYDVIPLSGARVALVVGDVVGHGIHASATMGWLRTAVRTLADSELPPDELLTRLDDIVGHPPSPFSGPDEDAYDPPGAGATCLYAVYDPVSRHCTLARAGHPPPAVVLPDGTAEIVDVPAGPPLGLGGLPFENRELDLPEGSLLALYTDGLIERRDRDMEEGTTALLEAVALPASSLEKTCDAVLGSMPAGRSQDDVAMLLARTRALDPAHVATWEFPADPAIVGLARETTARQLADWGLDEAAFTTEIVVSELVTNAIRYASGPIGLRLILEDNLICEVADSSNTFPRLRRAQNYDEGGRGLLLVAQLSRRWGTRGTDTGKIVWAEQPAVPHTDDLISAFAV